MTQLQCKHLCTHTHVWQSLCVLHKRLLPIKVVIRKEIEVYRISSFLLKLKWQLYKLLSEAQMMSIVVMQSDFYFKPLASKQQKKMLVQICI